MKWISLADRAVGKLERLLIIGASLCLLSMMLVVAVDVGMRYIFHAPLSWSYDLVANFLMVGAALLAVSETFRRGGHVAVNLFRARMRRKVRRWVDAASALMIIPVLLAMVVTGWQSTVRAVVRDETIPGVVAWPMWASYILVPLGIGLLLLRMIIHFADLVSGGEGHVPDAVDLHADPSEPAADSKPEGDAR